MVGGTFHAEDAEGKALKQRLLPSSQWQTFATLHCRIGIPESDLAVAAVMHQAGVKVPGIQSGAPLLPQTPSSVTHELRHAVDFTDPKIRKQEIGYGRRVLAKAGALIIGSFLAIEELGPRATQEVDNLTHLPAPVSLGITGIVMYAGARKISTLSERHFRKKLTTDSPMEKLGYATQPMESVLPAVCLKFEAQS
jgi:hypothetical protein